MADQYKKLTADEQAYWDIYARLRNLSDWAGFGDEQQKIKLQARDWLQARRKRIHDLAQPKSKGGDGKGWDHANRSERYAQLSDGNLNTSTCRRVCQLPTNGCTDWERCQISEREMWWLVASVDATTKAWKKHNADNLVRTRQAIWAVANPHKWDVKDRDERWANLCIATKTGKAYDAWKKTHNPRTGAHNKPEMSSRAKVVKLARSHLGTSEHPAGSNKGNPQPSTWQKRVIGADGFAWCACFATCMAWDAGVKGGSSAGVQVCMTMAQRGQGMYRGWTTDPAKVRRGDFAVIGCSTCHIEVVVDSSDPYHTIGGNTSPGSEGSQFNGGTVAEKHRGRGEVVGWCLVDYP